MEVSRNEGSFGEDDFDRFELTHTHDYFIRQADMAEGSTAAVGEEDTVASVMDEEEEEGAQIWATICTRLIFRRKNWCTYLWHCLS